MFRKIALVAAAVAALAGVPAAAAVYVVSAGANSSSGGAGLATISLTSGQNFSISSDTNDLWSAGPLPRFSDANGLTGVRLATAADDSGQLVGTQIGANFGLWGQHGISAPYGSLVGELGGVFQFLGANFSGPAWGNGTLNFYYWDSNNGDNSGSIAFNVSTGAIPEPASWAMMIAGFGMVGFAMRRRRMASVLA